MSYVREWQLSIMFSGVHRRMRRINHDFADSDPSERDL